MVSNAKLLWSELADKEVSVVIGISLSHARARTHTHTHTLCRSTDLELALKFLWLFFQFPWLASGNDAGRAGKNHIKWYVPSDNLVARRSHWRTLSKDMSCLHCVLNSSCYQSNVQKENLIFLKRVTVAHSLTSANGEKTWTWSCNATQSLSG